MEALRVLNLGVRFVLELCALAAFGYWAATIPAAMTVRVIAASIAVTAVALFWGAFVSPKARFPSGRFGPVVLGLLVFLGAAELLWGRHHTSLAAAYAVVAVLSSAVLSALPQTPRSRGGMLTRGAVDGREV
jgi:hypothetical protein